MKSCPTIHSTHPFAPHTQCYRRGFIIKAGDYAAEKIKTPAVVSGVQSARDTLHAAVAKAREAADPDVAVQLAWDAWTKFAAYPPGE